MIRKLKFPIKLKLTLSISAIILFTTAIYLYIALDLYKKDKTAYIYDSTLDSASTLANHLEGFLEQQYRDLNSLARAYNKEHLNAIKSFFTDSTSLVEFSCYNLKSKQLFRISSKEYSNSKRKLLKSDIILITNNEQGPQYYAETNRSPSYLQITQFKPKQKKIYLAKIALPSILKFFISNSSFQSALLDNKGTLLGHTNLAQNQLGENWIQRPVIKEIMTTEIQQGVHRGYLTTEPMLVAYAAIKKFKLYAISSISEKKSLAVIETLITKTILISLFVVSFAIIISIFMSRFLTSHLGKLADATLQIAKGNFKDSLSISSNDEIGILSDSFNYMSKEIQRFTEEMKEKIRMENELNVAKLVQSSFFPPEEIQLEQAYLASFYQPASECGGDWWGYLQPNPSRLVLMVGDATGHGVPAALATATVNCCANNIKELATIDPTIYQSSARILNYFNKAVTNNSGDILMTFFVAIIDFDKKSIQYSNAGHNPALLCNYDSQPTRKDIAPLKGANGLRLGIDANASYDETKITYQDNSYLVLYSDGLVEGANGKNHSWGPRRFYNTIVERNNYQREQLRDQIIANALSSTSKYYDNLALDDDLTLVTLYLPPQKNNGKSDHDNVFVGRGTRCDNIKEIAKNNLSHLICHNQPDFDFECQLTKRGALSLSSFFEKEQITSINVHTSSEIIPAIDQLIEKVSTSLNHISYAKILRTVATELLSNAIFNAPVDSEGKQKYTQADRRKKVILLENETVQLDIAVNKNYAAISVLDLFGTLSKEKIINSIQRGFDDKTHVNKPGGAGLGLFMLYSYANKIIIERQVNKKLRFTVLIHNLKKFKNYKEANTSFHFSEKEVS